MGLLAHFNIDDPVEIYRSNLILRENFFEWYIPFF